MWPISIGLSIKWWLIENWDNDLTKKALMLFALHNQEGRVGWEVIELSEWNFSFQYCSSIRTDRIEFFSDKAPFFFIKVSNHFSFIIYASALWSVVVDIRRIKSWIRKTFGGLAVTFTKSSLARDIHFIRWITRFRIWKEMVIKKEIYKSC